MKITKRYARKVSHDYQSWEFFTTKDIQSVEEAIGPQKAG